MTNKLQFSIKITPSQLPNEARKFINIYFNNTKVVYIDKINDEYEVKLSNGTYINFDKNGYWNYISSDETIAANVLPKNIANKLKSIMKKYKNAHVFEISKRIKFYRVRLSNSLDLCISHNGNLLA